MPESTGIFCDICKEEIAPGTGFCITVSHIRSYDWQWNPEKECYLHYSCASETGGYLQGVCKI